MSSFIDTSGEYDWMLKLSEEKYQLDMQEIWFLKRQQNHFFGIMPYL